MPKRGFKLKGKKEPNIRISNELEVGRETEGILDERTLF